MKSLLILTFCFIASILQSKISIETKEFEISRIKSEYVEGEFVKFDIKNSSKKQIALRNVKLYYAEIEKDSLIWLPFISKNDLRVFDIRIKKHNSLSYTLESPERFLVSDSNLRPSRKLSISISGIDTIMAKQYDFYYTIIKNK